MDPHVEIDKVASSFLTWLQINENDYRKPHKLGSNYDILTNSPDTFGNTLPPKTVLLIYCHLICISLLPGHVTQDVYTKEKARQDHLGNFSAPAVNTLTQRRHSGRLPANRLGTADTNVCPAALREGSVSGSCWSWTNYSPAWVLLLSHLHALSRTEVLPSLWLMKQNLTLFTEWWQGQRHPWWGRFKQ